MGFWESFVDILWCTLWIVILTGFLIVVFRCGPASTSPAADPW